jgi:hypothetical protein
MIRTLPSGPQAPGGCSVPRYILIAGLLTIAAALGNTGQAAVLDLTTINSSGTINSAIYEQAGPQSTGTGTVDTFVQQSPPGGDTTSRAFNTTVNNILDNKSSDQHNHDITLGMVPLVLRGNTLYREFLLDTNESSGGGNEFISLDEVQIFVGGTANSIVTTFGGGLLNHDGTLVYRMDANADSWVALNYDLNSGSGSGDMFLLVPQSFFDSYADSANVVLYSEFGLQGVNPPGFTGDFGGTANYEEWAVREGVSVPAPSTAVLLSLFVAGALATRRK